MSRLWWAFLGAGAITYGLTPLVRHLALRLGVLKPPGDRGVHRRPVPHIGGLAIVAGVLAMAWGLDGDTPVGRGIIIGGLLITFLGLLDDLLNLPAWGKFFGQVLVAALVAHAGVRIQAVTDPFGGMIATGLWSVPLTVFWLVAVMNTINLIDGLDGLAAGLSGIASLTLLTVALRQSEPAVAILAAAVAGSAAAFLRFNFNPAKIFMGDTGSLFLGYMLGVLAVVGTLKDATTIALAIPILALGIPIFDTGFAIVRRVANHRPIGEADRGHLHHRLLDLGLNQRQAVLLLYFVSLLLGGLASALPYLTVWEALGLGGFIGTVLLAGAFWLGLFRVRQGVGWNRPQ